MIAFAAFGRLIERWQQMTSSALIGIAIAEGKLPGTDATVPELFLAHANHIAPDERTIALEHMINACFSLCWLLEISNFTV